MITRLAAAVLCASLCGASPSQNDPTQSNPAQSPHSQSPAARQIAPDQIGEAAVPRFSDGTRPFGAAPAGSGKVLAEGGQYRADFDRHGVALSTPAARGAELPNLTLTFLGSARGATTELATQDVDPVLTGNFVRYPRNSLVETYEATATGYEQTFHIPYRPTGHGDLVLSMAVSGNVHAEAMAASHRAIEFVHGETRAIRYSEAYAFDRTGTRVDVLTRYDGAGRLELIVPSAFLDRANYPVVVDPSVGPVFNPGTGGWNDFNPDVAYDPVT